jgi:hypothetical protein
LESNNVIHRRRVQRSICVCEWHRKFERDDANEEEEGENNCPSQFVFHFSTIKRWHRSGGEERWELR